MDNKFDGFSWPEGSYLPPELRQILPRIKRLSDLKVLICILDSYFQYGLDSRPMTFSELQTASGLARQSVNDGVKNLLKDGLISRLAAGDTYAYEPSLNSRLPCHALHDDIVLKEESQNEEKEHASWESKSWTREIFDILVNEFGVASRVAQDIAETRDSELVMRQIEYTRYEIGVDGFQPRNLAGFIVARIRDDRPVPLGYQSQDPMADLPTGTDNHQRIIDGANGGEAIDPVEMITKHHYWGFMDAPGIELPGKKRERAVWVKAGERLLGFVPEPYDIMEVCANLDEWWTDDEQDEFYKDNPLSDKALVLIAKYIKSGGKKKDRWFTDEEYEDFFLQPGEETR